MEKIPSWALSLAYWLHMLATVVWIGGLASLALWVMPAARKFLDAAAYARLTGRFQADMNRIGWLALAVLGGTGMAQMSANPNYKGFLAIDSPWAGAILAKHIAVLGMVIVAAVLTWGVLPAVSRMALRRAAGKPVDPDEQRRLDRRESALLWINLALSALVLLFTALARAGA